MTKPLRKSNAGYPTSVSSRSERSGRFEGLRRHAPAAIAGVGAIAVVAAVAVLFITADDTAAPVKLPEFTIVSITPPPPPPPQPEPPPPEEQDMPEPEMIEQEPITEPEIEEEAPVEEPKDAPPDEGNDEPPPGPLGLDADAEGPGDSFNLAARAGGQGLLSGGGGGGGSRWGWYASMVQQQIETALRNNPKTRNAVVQVKVRLWADGTGRVTRVQIVSSSGDADVVSIMRNEVLAGLSLSQPPPADMPMPLVARITSRRPG